MFAATLVMLAIGAANWPFPAVKAPPQAIAWGQPVEGLAVGLFTDTPSVDASELPHLHLFLANRGGEDIYGVIHSYDRCVVVLNGVYFTRMDSGGPHLHIHPGKQFELPIEIPLEGFSRTDALRSPRGLHYDDIRGAPSPQLKSGQNTLCIYYFFGRDCDNFARSGDVQVTAK